MWSVPDVVQNKARALHHEQWLRDLPEVVEFLCASWGLVVGDVFIDATEAFVCEAINEQGESTVLKVLLPQRDAWRHERTVLSIANGEGCARLLASDETTGALLLERLGPSLYDLGLDFDARLEILCSTARQLWRPAPDSGLPSGRDKARWLVAFISSTWERLNHPCTTAAVDYALRCAARRELAHDDERSVLVHGDVHQWNVLRSSDGYKLIDPDGLLAEAEYDLGVLMREDPRELRADPLGRARWLARRCDLSATAVWEWGVVERVSTGLLATEVGLQPIGEEMLSVADLVAGPDFADGP